MIKCFMIEPTGESWVSLRRYSHDAAKCGATGWSFHNAETPLGKCRVWKGPYDDDGVERRPGRDWHYHEDAPKLEEFPPEDPRWPRACSCGHVFADGDAYQIFTDRIYAGPDGQEHSLRNPPAGALWYAEWLEGLESDHWWHGPDGRILMAQTPGGQWCIDSRASNCTMPEDNEHRCWVRHGTPPDIHVDKNGKTCAAGAGSIVSGNYHGFLHNGHFT